MESNLHQLLNKAETQHLEHISGSTGNESIAQTVCAFLNSGGGTLLVEAGTAPQAAKNRQTEIIESIRTAITPASLWSAVLEQAGGEYLCVIDVPAGRDRPYVVENVIYLRRGAQTLKAGPDDIRDLVETSVGGGERWERKVMVDGDLDRLDEELILTTAEEAVRRRNYPLQDSTNVQSILTDLSMYRRQAITQAAEVVFGRRPAIPFPQVRVRLTVYASDKGGEFLDNRQFEAAAIPMLEQVFSVIRQHTPIAGTFDSGLKRTDRPAYPEAAMREGLVNALVHRDYANFSGGIAIDMYPGRLVIWNSGSLPSGITIGDLKREHPSMPRNPDIAQVFFLRGFMERVGRGTQKILDECKEAGLPVPTWTANDAGVTLTFHNKLGRSSTKLNLRQKKLLEESKPGDVLKLGEYCERFAISDRQARRDLGDLLQNGWLDREGEGPSTVFVRTQKTWNSAKPGQTRPNQE
ncbi:ATP-binding protein [Planctomicrobium piriforme]|uniref:ATP-dependent DNA helicase RecG n=1 Tax=Planctomicrobium piriforme TaxID=1576369 RepID=A0A1I3FWA3_9PLAN|nr:ATP-binding protein [Planctomicrobium piriforme]SFI15352.1 ATP-dependent DNA helicase RecG [Planctomicrobium piriforme]